MTPQHSRNRTEQDRRLAPQQENDARVDSSFAFPKIVENDERSSLSRRARIDFSYLNKQFQTDQSSEARVPPQTIESFANSLDEEEVEQTTALNGRVEFQKNASSWGVSVITHIVILLLFTLIVLPSSRAPVVFESVFSEQIGDQLDFLTDDEGNLNPNDEQFYALNAPEEIKVDDFIAFEREKFPFDANANAPFFEQTRIETNDALQGRTDPGIKNDLLSKYGGNKLTEESVEAGLAWLKRNQDKDGSWSLQKPYADGVSVSFPDNRPAATAMALLAFQGAGNALSTGKYSTNVKKGLNWLLKQQNRDGSFAPKERGNETLFYTQALCVIALCELVAMERNVNGTPNANEEHNFDDSMSDVVEQARKAVSFLLENQHKKLGGWKYVPQESSDLSVTGWCLVALKTAEMAGIDVPVECYERISNFLDSVSYDDGAGYVYQLVGGKVTDAEKRPSMTATGLMCREYLGWTPDVEALQNGAKYLTQKENLIHFPTKQVATVSSNQKSQGDDSLDDAKNFSHNVYGWYSTSMALRALGPYNRYWRQWNAALCKELPLQQEPQGSKEAGSWNPQYDQYTFGGGRLYVTCLCVLCLEVYYRPWNAPTPK